MDKVRITEIAKELGMKNKEIVDKAIDLGLDVKGHSSSISTEDAEKLMNYVLSGENAQASKPSPQPKAPEIKKVEVVETPAVVEKPKAPEVVVPKTKTLKEKELEAGQSVKVHKEIAPKTVTEPLAEDEDEDMEDKLDPTNVRKRRGLVIVKKKRPDVKEVEAEEKPSPSSFYGSRENTPSRSMESMFASTTNNSAELQKKKKKLKKVPAEKKANAEKLDIALNIEMADTNIDTEEEDMIVLPDLNVGITVNEEAKKKKQIDPSQIRTTKKTNFVMQGIQRVGRKRRRRPTQVQEAEAVSAIEIPE